MAASMISLSGPFTSRRTNFPPLSNKGPTVLKLSSLRANAIAKQFEPAKVVPQADRVLVRLEDLSEKLAGGVLLPKSAVNFERYLVGEVLSVGTEVGDVETAKKVLNFSLSVCLEVKTVGILEVKLIEAKELTNKDIIGKSDPFAKIFIRPLRDRTKTSKTIDNQINPIWNEHFEFEVEDVSTQNLTVG